MTREEAIRWMKTLKKSTVNWVGEVDNNIKARCEKAEQEAFDMAIEALQAKTGEWIPTSERLPKAEDMYQPPERRYLCQLEAYGERKFCVLSRLKGAVSPFWDWYGVAVHDCEVTAWMPLPEPYKGGDTE
jgi:hypothetical protein